MVGMIGILGCAGIIIGGIMVAVAITGEVIKYYQAKDAAEDAESNAKKMQRLQHRQERKAEVQAKGQRKLEDRILKQNEDKMRQQVASSIAAQNLRAEWADLDKQRVTLERIDDPGRRRGYGGGSPVSGA